MQITICCCTRFFGEGLKLMLERELQDPPPKVDVCSDPRELFRNNPDLLLVDYNALSALTLETFERKGTKTLLLGTSCASLLESQHFTSLVSKGLIGIVTSDSNAATLRNSVVAAISGEMWLTRTQFMDLLRAKGDTLYPDESIALTTKEKEIVKLLCRGYRNKTIMTTLQLSEQAVKSHITRIGRKFGVTDRLQIALCALKRWPYLL
jgi:DNA-binding NarL/FixJ family response regulator